MKSVFNWVWLVCFCNHSRRSLTTKGLDVRVISVGIMHELMGLGVIPEAVYKSIIAEYAVSNLLESVKQKVIWLCTTKLIAT